MRILFVCTGNICRSTMAEGLFKDLVSRAGIEDVTVSSSGTWGLTGEMATPPARQVMEARGVDITSHRARELDPKEVEEADLVVAMTSVHLREISKAAPAAIRKTFLLKELAEMEMPPQADGGPRAERIRALLETPRPRWRRELDLDDPMGLPHGVYERCGQEIEAGVNRLFDLLLAGSR